MAESTTDSALAALMKYVEEEERRLGIVPVRAPRNWVPCQWCGGGPANGPGCAACFNARVKKERELDEEYKRLYPDGPKPIFTADPNDPQQMEQLKRVFHADVLTKAFSEGGGGIEEICRLAEAEMAKRAAGTRG